MKARYYFHALFISGKGWLAGSQESRNPRILTFHLLAELLWFEHFQTPDFSRDQNLFPLTLLKVSLLSSPEAERNESLILSSTFTSQLNKRYYSMQFLEAVIFIEMKNFFPQVQENTWYLPKEMEIFHGAIYGSGIFTGNNLNQIIQSQFISRSEMLDRLKKKKRGPHAQNLFLNKLRL